MYGSDEYSYSMSYKGAAPSTPGGPTSSQFSKEVFNPVNLKEGCDILLHFNPRLKDKSLVFNSFYAGTWGYEEKAGVVFPFEKKRIYTVEFFASSTNPNSVLVYVNGHFLYEFHQRQSAASTTSVEVNLKEDSDILLHFNPRLKDKSLVFNSFYAGTWGYEEKAGVVFPFEKKRIYTVEFFASSTNPNSVLVYVNGHFLYEFHQRQSAASTTSVEVKGDIFIHSIHVT
ncbi:galactoside-binding lectin [Oesophagostomum dentatum]|uniref:Galectin n=1 Tax=Oesophagostomum dentatum TaxID=61180 RepID=A0A0B1SUE2_OESDE|nr:galactoside-binding lectin [Oesophagostomum dentatum]